MSIENDELRAKVHHLNRLQNEQTGDKHKFMEGAVWMGKKMTAEVESICQSFEFLLIEYRQRLADPEHKDSAAEWLSEAVKAAGFDLYEKTINILEGAAYHQDDAQQQLKQHQRDFSF